MYQEKRWCSLAGQQTLKQCVSGLRTIQEEEQREVGVAVHIKRVHPAPCAAHLEANTHPGSTSRQQYG